MSTAHAVIFDLDGTLLDTIQDIADSMNSVLERLHAPPHDQQTYKGFVGQGIEQLVFRALPEALRDDEATLEQAISEMRRTYGERWDRTTRPFSGIPELLDKLSEGGVPMGIHTNKPHGPTLEIVRRLLPHWSFAAIRGARPEEPKKPRPDGALAIARELHLSPAAFLFVGDSGTDMQTARAAGMTAVGVLWGFRGADELQRNGAHHLLHHPSDLTELFDRSRDR
jgi:phosphoglycolate phosphatase